MYAEKPVVLPFFTGHVARGLLLHFIRLVDPAASGLLHELNVSKPYSVTPLRFRSSQRTSEGYVLDPQFPCKVGFRFLKDEYSTYLLNFFQKQNTALIFDTTFQIASMSINCKTYADLEKEAQAVDGFTLDFRTPTYLANLNSNYHWMFPDPVKVFCSLMRCWNQFSDERRFTKEEYVAYKDWLGKECWRKQIRAADAPRSHARTRKPQDSQAPSPTNSATKKTPTTKPPTCSHTTQNTPT